MRRFIVLLSASSLGCTLFLSNALEGRVCGDGVVDVGLETCDDGNSDDSDGCSSSCKEEAGFCGDNVVGDGEQCDDGNATGGDGCDAACQGEPGSCGDGVINLNTGLLEACDDGNTIGGDGCRADCDGTEDCGDGLLDVGESCDDGNTISNDGCDAACVSENCGDGNQDPGEGCDDFNNTNNDGCDAVCQSEAEFFVRCDGSVGIGTATSPFGTLLEGITAASAGNTVMILPGSPECAGNITIDKDLTLRGPVDLSPLPIINGGDATAALIMNTAGTTITVKDLALTSNFNGGTVRVSNGASVALLRVDAKNIRANNTAAAIDCSGSSALLVDQSFIHDSPGCGVHARSSCLALATNSLFQRNGGASDRGAIRAEPESAIVVALSTFDENKNTSGRGAMECNDAALLETADSIIANNNNGGAFDFDCNLLSSITFGVSVDGIEMSSADPLFVDDLNGDFHLLSNSPAIDAASPFFTAPFDPITLFGVDVFSHDFEGNPRPIGGGFDIGMFEAPLCGNGAIETGESCDDGNSANGDGCESNCTLNECGNGFQVAPEECDDNNLNDGDGCQSDCSLSICGDAIADNALTVDNNADGIPDLTEECDDANLFDGDGCDNNCQRSCGNGIPEATNLLADPVTGEQCDDGNNNNNDDRPNDCVLAVCGDAIREGREECDEILDGNGDGCDNDCQNSCGNGILDVQNNEACDDGDGVGNDGCNNNCVITVISEAEPNDDGSIAPGNFNDFSLINAQTIGNSAIVQANIANGDEDTFRLTNTSTINKFLSAETGSNSQLSSCTFDSIIRIRDINGNEIAGSDDGGLALCSQAEIIVLPGQTVFIQVMDINDSNSFSYFLRVLFQ